MGRMAAEFDIEKGRASVAHICLAFPEAETDSRSGQHTGFTVRGKAFAWYLVDHHGNGRITFSFRVALQAQEAMVAAEPARFFASPYVGRYGWTEMDLTVAEPDWEDVAEFARGSYRIVAPKRLTAMLP